MLIRNKTKSESSEYFLAKIPIGKFEDVESFGTLREGKIYHGITETSFISEI
jgi:hypothetical protein